MDGGDAQGATTEASWARTHRAAWSRRLHMLPARTQRGRPHSSKRPRARERRRILPSSWHLATFAAATSGGQTTSAVSHDASPECEVDRGRSEDAGHRCAAGATARCHVKGCWPCRSAVLAAHGRSLPPPPTHRTSFDSRSPPQFLALSSRLELRLYNRSVYTVIATGTEAVQQLGRGRTA